MFEDLDFLAGSISYKHCGIEDYEKSDLYLVTASVDKIIKHKDINLKKNYILRGHVSFVGSSSMEVFIKLQENDQNFKKPELIHKQEDAVLSAKFTMVAMSKRTNSPTHVNKLQLTNDLEKKLFEEGRDSRNKKKYIINSDLKKTPPNEREKLIIHDFYISGFNKSNDKNKKYTNMKDTEIQSVTICHPQVKRFKWNKNRHGYIFGGYLMRESFEV